MILVNMFSAMLEDINLNDGMHKISYVNPYQSVELPDLGSGATSITGEITIGGGMKISFQGSYNTSENTAFVVGYESGGNIATFAIRGQ